MAFELQSKVPSGKEVTYVFIILFIYLTKSYNKRIVESIIFKIVITANSMIKMKKKKQKKNKPKKNLRMGFITEWEVVIFIMILLLFQRVNLKYKLV